MKNNSVKGKSFSDDYYSALKINKKDDDFSKGYYSSRKTGSVGTEDFSNRYYTARRALGSLEKDMQKSIEQKETPDNADAIQNITRDFVSFNTPDPPEKPRSWTSRTEPQSPAYDMPGFYTPSPLSLPGIQKKKNPMPVSVKDINSTSSAYESSPLTEKIAAMDAILQKSGTEEYEPLLQTKGVNFAGISENTLPYPNVKNEDSLSNISSWYRRTQFRPESVSLSGSGRDINNIDEFNEWAMDIYDLKLCLKSEIGEYRSHSDADRYVLNYGVEIDQMLEKAVSAYAFVKNNRELFGDEYEHQLSSVYEDVYDLCIYRQLLLQYAPFWAQFEDEEDYNDKMWFMLALRDPQTVQDEIDRLNDSIDTASWFDPADTSDESNKKFLDLQSKAEKLTRIKIEADGVREQEEFMQKVEECRQNEDFEEKSQFAPRRTADQIVLHSYAFPVHFEVPEDDVTYLYVNDAKTESGKSFRDMVDENDKRSLTKHSRFANLTQDQVKIYNYLFSQSVEDANRYLELVAPEEYTGMAALAYGLANGTGLESITIGLGNLFSIGNEEQRAKIREGHNDFKKNSAAAAQQHPYMYTAGSIGGTLAAAYVMKNCVSSAFAGLKLVGNLAAIDKTAKAVKPVDIAVAAARNALTYTTLYGIQNLGDVTTGEISLGDYLWGAGKTAAGSIAATAVSYVTAVGGDAVLKKYGLEGFFAEWTKNMAAGMAGSLTYTATDYVMSREKPSKEEIANQILLSFLITTVFSAETAAETTGDNKSRALKYTGKAEKELREIVEKYNKTDENGIVSFSPTKEEFKTMQKEVRAYVQSNKKLLEEIITSPDYYTVRTGAREQYIKLYNILSALDEIVAEMQYPMTGVSRYNALGSGSSNLPVLYEDYSSLPVPYSGAGNSANLPAVYRGTQIVPGAIAQAALPGQAGSIPQGPDKSQPPTPIDAATGNGYNENNDSDPMASDVVDGESADTRIQSDSIKRNNSSWYNQDGSINYPPNKGAVYGTEVDMSLKPGDKIARYGNIGETSVFVTQAGSDANKLALPPNVDQSVYQEFLVVKEIPNTIQAEIASWGDSEGGGIQYELPMTIVQLIKEGYIVPN